MTYKKAGLIAIGILLCMVSLASFPAKANITLTPTIVVIDGRERYADIHVLNTTAERQTYELSWRYLKMTEGSGSYVKIDSSLTDFDLSKHLVYTPRKITLAPKSAQKVRLGLRLKGAPPPPGDYRAHLEFLNTPAEDESDIGGVASEGNTINVGMKVAFSIPIIYRVGDKDAGDAEIGRVTTEINQKSGKIEAVIPITRADGSYGTTGSIIINYGGKRIGQLRNANIFPEIKTRTFRVPLDVQTLAGGELNIIYRDFDADKNHIFDEKNIRIAQ